MSSTIRFHPKLTECKQCKQFEYTYKLHPNYVGCYTIQCTLCCIQWFVCVKHNKRFNFQNKTYLRHHFQNEHSCNNYNESLAEDNDNMYVSFTDGHSDGSDNELGMIQTTKKPKHVHQSNTLQITGHTQKTDNIYSDNALKCLVGKAFSNSEYNTMDVNQEETDFHLNMTHFCSGLPEAKQHHFMDIIHQVLGLQFHSTRPPRSYQDLRRFYLSGKHAIYKNIPCPTVKQLDNHACVSLLDIITLSFNNLNHLALIRCSEYAQMLCNNSSMANTLKAKQIVHKIYQQYNTTSIDPYVMFVSFWSDDFEINQTRKNRSSTWIKTMSLITTEKTDTSKHYTHLVAIGHKGNDHTTVNSHINAELQLLQNVEYYYVHMKKCTIPVVIYPLAILADRPERCALNLTLSYTGNSTRRWLYSSLTSSTKLASCKQCYLKRINTYFDFSSTTEITTNKSCGRCCDFNFLTSSKAASFNAPQNYPSSKHKDSPTFPTGRDIVTNLATDKLYPVTLSYQYLYDGVKFASFNLYTKTWKTSETRCYLKVLGVSSSLCDTIIEYCLKSTNENTSYTTFYNSLPVPDIWLDKILEIDQFVETPMHHLFEGIVKSLLEVTMEFLKYFKSWSKYCERINPILDDIDSLKCDFCRIEAFWHSKTDYKPSGWIAENYLGYSRILLILTMHMESIIHANEKGFKEYKCMIQSSFVLISHLMTRAFVSVNTIEDIIKIFLYSCHNFDITFGYSVGNIPFWYKKSNFVSLLNLPEQITTYGPIHLYWEGVKERYIQYVKPILKNKRKTVSFLSTKVHQLLQNNALDLLKNRFSKHTPKVYSRYNNIYVFSTNKDLEEKINNGESFSVMIRKTHVIEIFAICKKNDTFGCYPLIFDDNQGFHKYNLWFAPLNIKKGPSRMEIHKETIASSQDYAGLLVSFQAEKNLYEKNIYYTLLSSDWSTRSQTGLLELPSLSRELFEHE